MKWLLVLWPLTGGTLDVGAVLSTEAMCEAVLAAHYDQTGKGGVCVRLEVDRVASDVILYPDDIRNHLEN